MNITKESIFVASVRSLCTSFATVIGILIGIILFFIGMMLISPPSMIPAKTEIEIAIDAEGKRDVLPSTTPAILRIDVHGVIGQPDLNSETIDNILLDSREGMLSNNRVKGILLHINSPGGTVTDADDIYTALQEYKRKYNVPVFAFVDGLCASGGMYISAGADRIYATPSSVIGSIGVILGPSFNFSQLMDKVGIQSLTISEGKDKDMLNPFRPWKEGEDRSLRTITACLYERFVSILTNARPSLNKEKLINDYGAQVFIAAQAQQLGYIDDANSNYSQALRELVKAAGISEDQHYQVIQLKSKRSFFSDLVQSHFSILKGKVTHVFQFGSNLDTEMSGKFLYLFQPESP